MFGLNLGSLSMAGEKKERVPLAREVLADGAAHPLATASPGTASDLTTASSAAAAAVTTTMATATAAPEQVEEKMADESAFSGDDSEEGDVMFSLFLDEDYKELVYEFTPGVSQTVLALTSAGTDYDLTGQIVWPVSVFLAWFVAANEPLFRGKTVVELGSGTALGGFVSARVSAHTALTDGNGVVLKMLRECVARGHATGAVVSVQRLLWGDEKNFEAFCTTLPRGHADVIIGADVVCWPLAVRPLLTTVKALLLRAPAGADAAFYCGFVCRAVNVQHALMEQCEALDIEVVHIAAADFLPSPPPANVFSQRELNLLRLSLKPGADREVRWQDCDAALGSAC